MSAESQELELEECDECGKRFLDKTRLNQHKGSTHNAIDRYEGLPTGPDVRKLIGDTCLLRPNSYSAVGALHIPDETGENPTCRVNVQIDWRDKPLDVIPKGWSEWCRDCVLETVRNGDVEYPCEECGRDFDTYRALGIHMSQAHDTLLTRDCGHCGDEFHPPMERIRFCSYECAFAHREDKASITCAECGDEFKVRRSREESATYCSEDCRLNSFPDKVTNTCETCESEFEVEPCKSDQRFCCRECYYESIRGASNSEASA